MDGASFLISLEEKISGSAKKGASSLAELDAQIKKDSSSIKTMEAALKRMESSGEGSTERMNGLRSAIDAKKSSIAQATTSIADMAGKTDEAGEKSSFLGEKMAAMGGPIGVAIAVATALAAALFMVGKAMVSMAIEAASAQARQLRLAEAMTGNASMAKSMVDATYRVSGSVALAGTKVQELGASLMKAGLSGKTYETSLKNLANVASVAGDQAVGPLKEIIEKSQQLGHLKMEGDQLKGTGLQAKEVFEQLSKDLGIGIKDVEKRLKDGKITAEQGISAMNAVMGRKFGKLGEAALLDFDTQIAKAKENAGNLFKDVNLEPAQRGLADVLSLLDSNTASGRILKGVLTGAMNAFFSAAGAALPYVKEFILGIAIAGLRLYISLRPAIATLKEVLGIEDSGTADGMKTAADAGKVLVGAIATIVGAVAIFVGAVGGMAYAVAAPFFEVGMAAYGAYQAIAGAFGQAQAYLSGLDFSTIASDLIAGLVSGIASGTGLVIDAISNLGGAAMAALKSKLGIASPSKVFREYGGFTAEGFAGGVDDGAADVKASVTNLVQTPAQVAPSNVISLEERRAAAGGGGGGARVHVDQVLVQVSGAADPRAVADEVAARFQDEVDDLALQAGIPLGEAA